MQTFDPELYAALGQAIESIDELVDTLKKGQEAVEGVAEYSNVPKLNQARDLEVEKTPSYINTALLPLRESVEKSRAELKIAGEAMGYQV